MGPRTRGVHAALALVLLAGQAAAADLDAAYGYEPAPGGGPRFFPRSDGVERPAVYGRLARAVPAAGCLSRRAPVPTNAPDDPSYVGSNYGLSHPSYYGFTPPPGVDDPYGRAPRPYCP